MTNRWHTDRRHARRSTDPRAHGIRSLRIKFGDSAVVINASASGALIETSHRLLPGAWVELHMETAEHRARVRGRVVRCAVGQVRPAGLLYRGGIAFEQHLPWFVPDTGYPLPGGQQSDSRGEGADATRVIV
jgi:hypothetical protein